MEFFMRLHALIGPEATVVDIGAGRGRRAIEDRVPARRDAVKLQDRYARVVGIDVDEAVRQNLNAHEAHVVDARDPGPPEDACADLVVSDHTIEHAATPETFAAEVERVLKPGGWFCARTPHKWSYAGIGTRLIPNSAQYKLIEKLQPSREDRDVFPTTFLMNTRRDLRRWSPEPRFVDRSYRWRADPVYHGGYSLLYDIFALSQFLLPPAKLHVFFQKKRSELPILLPSIPTE